MKLEEIDLSPCAVITIDIQNDYFHENGAFAKANNDVSLVQKIVPRIHWLLSKSRQLEIPIIHTHNEHSHWTDSVPWKLRFPKDYINVCCLPGSWGIEFHKIVPEPGEYVIAKHRYSAFVDTDLDLVLRSLQIKTIALVGAMTNVCVESTARHGYMKDYYVVVVEDCVAAASIEEHNAALFNIQKYFGVVANSQNLVDTWRTAMKTSEK